MFINPRKISGQVQSDLESPFSVEVVDVSVVLSSVILIPPSSPSAATIFIRRAGYRI